MNGSSVERQEEFRLKGEWMREEKVEVQLVKLDKWKMDGTIKSMWNWMIYESERIKHNYIITLCVLCVCSALLVWCCSSLRRWWTTSDALTLTLAWWKLWFIICSSARDNGHITYTQHSSDYPTDDEQRTQLSKLITPNKTNKTNDGRKTGWTLCQVPKKSFIQ